MNYKISLLMFLLINLAFHPIFGQASCLSQVQQAQAAYQSKNNIKAALLYRHAFSSYPDSVKAIDVYHSARPWAAAGNADSAIIQLQLAAMVYKFNKYGMLMADPVLTNLHQHNE